MKTLFHLLRPWTWRMAWRDSRRDRRRLLLFSCSIVFGIAALVSVGSLRENLQSAIELQARALLGADMTFRSNRPFSDKARKAIAKTSSVRAREVSFTSMFYLPKSSGAELVIVRATEAGFPFYGKVTTEPPEAWRKFQKGKGVLVEAATMEKMKIRAGDEARIGEATLPVLGRFVIAPPPSSHFAALAPQVFMPYAKLDAASAIGDGAMTTYRTHVKLPASQREFPKVRLQSEGVKQVTVEDRKRRLGRALDNLYSFFSLIGFVALLLGGIGVASAIHVHVSNRLASVATLRCLGASTGRAFAIYLLQAMFLGLFGTLAGVAMGIGLQKALPLLFASRLPFEIEFALAPGAIFSALGIGFLLCLSFALFPLLRIRRIPPLAAIRSQIARGRPAWRDPLFWMVAVLLAGVLLLVASWISPPRERGLGAGFLAALVLILALLALTAFVITRLARLVIRSAWPYTVRQGLANLHRPRNQTHLFLLSTGLGAFLIMTLLLAEHLLTAQLDKGSIGGKPNLYIVGVRPDQGRAVDGVLSSHGIDPMESANMVSMKLTKIKGKPIREAQKNERTKVPGRLVRRDFRSTSRSELTDAEELLKGELVPRFDLSKKKGPVPVSVEESIVRDLRLKLGDTFSMQVGKWRELDLKVASVRKVDWDSLALNFFIVFPEGALDGAPGFGVTTARIDDPEVSSKVQSAVSGRFANLTIFDLAAAFQTVKGILDNIGAVIRFMALFTVLTGALILVAVLLAGKRDRVAEGVLLRTLGASGSQVRRVFLTEYFLLGLFAALTGAVLAVAAGWSLARWVFEVEFLAHSLPLWICGSFVVLATILAGVLLSRGASRHPPLAILRQE